MARGIHVKVDGTCEVKEYSCLEDYQRDVGGLIEFVNLKALGRWLDCYANEEGLLIGLPVNSFARLVGVLIVGDIIVLGGIDVFGNSIDVGEKTIFAVQKLCEIAHKLETDG